MIPEVMSRGFTYRYTVVNDICLGVSLNSAIEGMCGLMRCFCHRYLGCMLAVCLVAGHSSK